MENPLLELGARCRVVCVHCANINRLDFPTTKERKVVCHSCKRPLPFFDRWACPICKTVNQAHSKRCWNCEANATEAVLPGFPSWPLDPDRGGWVPPRRSVDTPLPIPTLAELEDEESLDTEIRDLMPTKRVGDRTINPFELYLCLSTAYVRYHKLLREWCKDVDSRNERSHKLFHAQLATKHEQTATQAAAQYEAWLRKPPADPQPSVRPKSLFTTTDPDGLRELGGRDFELLLGVLFLTMGLHVELTPYRGDQGADLVVVNENGERTAVQAKNYRDPVGNSAIQEVLGGMRYYRCNKGLVVTTSQFTASARELVAARNDVELWDGNKLQELFVLHRIDTEETND